MLSFQTVATNKPDPEVLTIGIATPVVPTAMGSSVATAGQTRTGDHALTVIDLCKSFRSGFLKRRIRGIEGISFTVPRGTVFALLGHNGAGKTTTINCILDLVHPDRGEVRIMGRDHNRCESRTVVGYLPERPYFFEHLTGRELLEFYADLLGLPRSLRDDRIDEVLACTGLSTCAGRRLRKYSKGMLQRIGLSQALLGDPELLILDEPMSGLDPMGRRDVRELLLELKARGKTIILSSHIVPDIEMIADSVGIIRDGRLVDTRDLRDFSAGCTYQVNLSAHGRSLDGLSLPAWAGRQIDNSNRERGLVKADSVDRLRELLAACHAADVPVHSVETQRTGLEDHFMAIHANRGTEAVS